MKTPMKVEIKVGQIWVGEDDIPRTVVSVGNSYSPHSILLGFNIRTDLLHGWESAHSQSEHAEKVYKAGFTYGYWVSNYHSAFHRLFNPQRKKIILIPQRIKA